MSFINLRITDVIHFQEKQASKVWRISEEIGSLPWGRNLKVQNWTPESSIKLIKEKTSVLETAAKIVLMATVVIPLCAFLFKAYFRSAYKFEVIDPKLTPALKPQEILRQPNPVPPKEVIWPGGLSNNYINKISPLLEGLEGKKFLVITCATDRFEELLSSKQRNDLGGCDALVVLRWGKNVAAGTSQYIDAGMTKKPVIQIQYDDTHAKIISAGL